MPTPVVAPSDIKNLAYPGRPPESIVYLPENLVSASRIMLPRKQEMAQMPTPE